MNIATAVNYQLPHQPLKTEGEVPEWLLLLPAGHFKGLDGRQWTNPDSQAVLNETKRYGLDLPVDIEHATQLKSPEGSYAGAIAWIPLEEIEIREGAIWGKVAWNDRGDWMVRGRDYRYYSPVFSFDAKDRVIRLISVGLTNRPNLPQLPALNHQQQTTEEKPMTAIALLLGLAANASEDQQVAAIKQLQSDSVALNAQATNVDLSKYVPVETHNLAVARAEKAEETLALNAQEALKQEAEAILDTATKNGQLAPANRDQYLALCQQEGGLEQVKAIFSSAPKVIGDSSNLDDKQPGTQKGILSDEEIAVCSQLGLSQEEFLSVRDGI